MYCWSLAWRILNITLLACEMSAIGLVWAFLTKWYRDTGLYCSPLKSFHLGLHLINPKFWNLSPVLLTLGCLETALCIIQGLARFEQSLYTTWSSLIFPLWWLHYTLSLGSSSQSVQFSAVPQSCPTLCDPMNRSTPGLPVHTYSHAKIQESLIAGELVLRSMHACVASVVSDSFQPHGP